MCEIKDDELVAAQTRVESKAISGSKRGVNEDYIDFFVPLLCYKIHSLLLLLLLLIFFILINISNCGIKVWLKFDELRWNSAGRDKCSIFPLLVMSVGKYMLYGYRFLIIYMSTNVSKDEVSCKALWINTRCLMLWGMLPLWTVWSKSSSHTKGFYLAMFLGFLYLNGIVKSVEECTKHLIVSKVHYAGLVILSTIFSWLYCSLLYH